MRKWLVPTLVALLVAGVAPATGASEIKDRIAKQRQEIRAKVDAKHHARGIGRDHDSHARSPDTGKTKASTREPEARPRSQGPTAPRSDGKVIEVVIGEQSLRAWEDGRLVMRTPVSTGSSQYPTPRGEYSIKSRERNHWSTQYDVHMPYAMRVVRGIFIHELPISPDGRRLGERQLGHPVSHGCIRVGVGPAERLWRWAEIGTPVVIR